MALEITDSNYKEILAEGSLLWWIFGLPGVALVNGGSYH